MTIQFGTREFTTSPVTQVNFEGAQPSWILIIGAGNVVVKDQLGATQTYTSGGGEVVTGQFSALISFTCTKVRMGAGTPPPVSSNASEATESQFGAVKVSVAAADTANPIAVGQNDPLFTNAGLGIYGTGSDGTIHFDGATTVLGLAPVASVYTLTRDLYLAGGTVDQGVTIYAHGFKIYCNGTLTNNGTIHNNGHDAAADTAGAITNASGSLGIGTAGGAGVATSANGNNGTALTTGHPSMTGTGGAGGGDGTNTGGSGGTRTALAATFGGAQSIFALITGFLVGTATNGTTGAITPFGGGSGGGSGSSDSAVSTKSGGGGGGGGPLIVCAKILVNGGTLSANGGKGGDASSSAHNAGGGGGGQGGLLILVSRKLTNTGTVSATGGAGGAKAGTTGVAGTAGDAGLVISAAA